MQSTHRWEDRVQSVSSVRGGGGLGSSEMRTS